MRKVLYIMGQLDDQDIAWMAQTGRQRICKRGEVLIQEGVESPALFIVLDGEIEVLVAGVGRVASLGSGEILGEMSFVDKAPPSASVRAGTEARVLVLDKTSVEDRLGREPAFAGRFYKALAIFLADRLRRAIPRNDPDPGLASAALSLDELDEAVLDTVSVAGLRFQQMLKTLSAGVVREIG